MLHQLSTNKNYFLVKGSHFFLKHFKILGTLFKNLIGALTNTAFKLVLLILLHLDADLNVLCSYLWNMDIAVFPDWVVIDVVSSPASTLSCAPLLLQKLWREAPVSENLLADIHVEN